MAENGTDDFIIRTEDLHPDSTLDIYVPNTRDEQLVLLLRNQTPVIIEGSRGTGKSMLLRVCEQRQLKDFATDKVLPIYVSFNRSSLLKSPSERQFLHWMLSRLASTIFRAVQKQGLAAATSRALNVLTGGTDATTAALGGATRLEQVAQAFEDSYQTPDVHVDDAAVPTIEKFRDAIEDICDDYGIRRFNVLFDEAAHIFRPEQQRQFFTLFRDLRSSRMTCNAAVYPGVTSYGGVFEGTHDARIEQLVRDVSERDYAKQMRDIVLRQANSTLQKDIAERGENFDALAYAVSGNPRLLLKTVALAGKLRVADVQAVIKDFYRVQIWAEHSSLAERYPGHKALIDFGREFMQETVLPEAKKKNDRWRENKRDVRSNVIWVSRDAPAAAKEAIRLLTYIGVLSRIDEGYKGTASQIGARYAINVGCLVADEVSPIPVIGELRRHNTQKKFTEFGASNSRFVEIEGIVGSAIEADLAVNLSTLLAKPIAKLDLTDHQRRALLSVGLSTIHKALLAPESKFQEAKYIGPVRSKRMKNVVTAAALEYLSG
ncbi:ORC-CDC6 family AAA ATPase [Sphingobium sp. YR768]|uniref:ORC-CDC6 family AAA ATPase n=1 Tax=Sphingobium sp. YR768 TaxID=1884365 RepID=UPI0008C20DAD|nr:hypothetical protein [Sphingobium sp. YR768]SER82596.1 hypothetical protein SAMN05518866_12047 [Sphingobium sp. YR768]